VRGPRRKPRALLIDMDGVLRIFDPAIVNAVERKYGLSAGTLWHTASRVAPMHLALTGRITHDEWMAEVARALDAPEAVAEWNRYHGRIDPVVRHVVATVRAAGYPVALGTNATDRLDSDLAEFLVMLGAEVIASTPPAVPPPVDSRTEEQLIGAATVIQSHERAADRSGRERIPARKRRRSAR